MNEGQFFQDLAVLMTVSGLAAVIFSRLGWPKVLGYITSGILMSEYTWGGSFLSSPDTISVIAQLGVVFLMFGMGLSFSARELKRIRAVSLPIAIIDTLVMIWLGYVLGTRLFGWSCVASLFLGVAICDSATTLLAKVLDEMGWSDRPFARYVTGASVCEDIICVGAIAVVTGFAQGGGMSVGAFALSLGGLAAFFLSVLVFGLVLVPRLLHSIDRRHDDEALLLMALGCLFAVSFVAYRFDFSLALGAFLVGIVGSTTLQRAKLAQFSEPLKAMFSAMFFVSIGLLVDPSGIWHNLGAILTVSAVVVGGKFINALFASLIAGVEVKTAVQNAMALAQIGEFAFMVAILYSGVVGVASSDLFQITVGASLLTTLLNPAMIRLSDRAGNIAERMVPKRVNGFLITYRGWLNKMRSAEGQPEFILFKAAAIRLTVYGVLLFAVSVICMQLYRFDYSRFSQFFERHDKIFFFVLQNFFFIMMAPLVLSAARSIAEEAAVIVTGDGDARWQVSFRQLLQFIGMIVVIVLYFVEISMLNVALAPSGRLPIMVTSAILLLVAAVGWRFFVKASRRASVRFQEALTVEERQEGLLKLTTVTLPEHLMRNLALDVRSPAVGCTVAQLNVRAKTGASIVAVRRGEEVVNNIGPDWTFAVGDIVVALGDSAQIAALKDLLGVMTVSEL